MKTKALRRVGVRQNGLPFFYLHIVGSSVTVRVLNSYETTKEEIA